MRLPLLFAMLLSGCVVCSTHPKTGEVEYQERIYLAQDEGPLRLDQVDAILKRRSWGRGKLDLATGVLRWDSINERAWGFTTDSVSLKTSSDLWLLRKRRCGYINLFLIRRDANGRPTAIVRKQLGENGDLNRRTNELLKDAEAGDLILSMHGF